MNKFRNIRTPCFSTHSHASKLEAAYCNTLLARQQAGEIRSYAIQIRFPLYGQGGHVVCHHVVDFMVRTTAGVDEAHESKGKITRDYAIKKKLFEDNYPDIPYLLITTRGRGR